MMRRILATGVMALALAVAQPQAQTPTDFSGAWTVVEPVTSLGMSITITQDAGALRMDIPLWSIGVSSSHETTVPQTGTPTSVRHLVYNLDGSESKLAVPDAPPPPPNANPMTLMRSILVKSVARASWRAGQLVIVTHNSQKLTAPSRVPAEIDWEQTIWEKLSLESDGRLVVDRVIIADPLPWGTTLQAIAPASTRTIYKKAS